MQYLGEYRIDDYITFGAQLHRFSSGAVYAPTGNVTYTFYENNSTSGAPTGGNLAQLNSKTGLYTARVQLTAANGFEVGKEYLIHIEATVDSVAAAELLMFRIVGNPKVDVDTIKTQTVTCGAGVTVLASVGTASTSTAQTGDAYARIGSPTGASVSADLAAVKVDTAAILEDTDDIGAAGAGLTALGDTRIANLDAAVTSRLATSGYTAPLDAAATRSALGLATANLDTQIAGLPTDVDVQAAAAAALNAYDPPTKAELDSAVLPLALQSSVDDLEGRLTATRAGYLDNLSAGAVATASSIAALNNLSAAQVNEEVDTALADIYLDHLLAADYDPASKPGVATALLNELVESDSGVSRFTAAALEQAPAGGGGGGGLTAQQVRDAMKLAPTAGSPAAGSVDKHLDDIQTITDQIDVSAVTQVAASNAGHLTITATLTFDEAVTGLVIPANWETALWSLKRNAAEDDDQALIRLRATNPADANSDGLEWLNGAAAAPSALEDGALTVTQASGQIDIFLADELTAELAEGGGLGWDVKFIDGDGNSSGQRGTADVGLTETWAIE